MMIRALTVSLLFAVLAVPAYAQDSDPAPTSQDNPQTRQTDQSEDDYRRSQRRRDSGDIFEDIGINPNSTGTGNQIFGREVKAIDRLDQDSRRHLNKQRAKALAEAKPGEPIDAAYEPSETAKTDDYVAQQEQAAWEEMMREANSGLSGTQGQGSGGQGSGQQGQTGQQGQAGQGQSGSQAGQGGQQGQSGQGGQSGQAGQNGPSGNSPLRGGSASSASAILDRIKGRAGMGGGSGPQAGQGQSPQAGGQQGQSPQAGGQQGQSPQGQSPQGQGSQGQGSQGQGSAGQSPQGQAPQGQNGQGQSQAQANAQAAAQAASNVNAAAEAAAHHDEPMSPLERLKRDPIDRGDTGRRTSASDYLRRGD